MVVRLHLLPPHQPLPAHPGPAGAASNLARMNQQHVANAAVAGVGGVVYIDEVEAETMRRPLNRDNIDALDGINSAMLQATRMISAAIGRAHQPPQHQPHATAAAGVAPGGDGDLIASRQQDGCGESVLEDDRPPREEGGGGDGGTPPKPQLE